MLSVEELALELKLRSVRTVEMRAEALVDDDEDEEDEEDEDKIRPRNVTIYAGPGEFGVAWRISLRRVDLRVTAAIIALYSSPEELDVRGDEFVEVREEYVRRFGLNAVRPHIAALVASAEGILAATMLPADVGEDLSFGQLVDVGSLRGLGA